MSKEKEIISVRGDRNLWLDFTVKLKKERKQVWTVLEQWINKYLKQR